MFDFHGRAPAYSVLSQQLTIMVMVISLCMRVKRDMDKDDGINTAKPTPHLIKTCYWTGLTGLWNPPIFSRVRHNSFSFPKTQEAFLKSELTHCRLGGQSHRHRDRHGYRNSGGITTRQSRDGDGSGDVGTG